MSELSYGAAALLGVVEGLTEFLPVSSTAHLTIAEKALGYQVDDAAITAYTAIIQLGAIAATFVYFAKDIARLFVAWVRGMSTPAARTAHDYALAWAVVVGSIPVALVGLALRDFIEGPLRSLWVVAVALIVWSGAMVLSERRHSVLSAHHKVRGEGTVGVRDGLAIGLAQCLAVIPGVSRSGATISAGLVRGLDRVTATRLSFFLAIPALTAAGLFEAATTDLSPLGGGQMVLGIAVAFVVAYASIAWLLRFVSGHTLTSFVTYRVVVGVILIALLAAGVVAAT